MSRLAHCNFISEPWCLALHIVILSQNHDVSPCTLLFYLRSMMSRLAHCNFISEAWCLALHIVILSRNHDVSPVTLQFHISTMMSRLAHVSSFYLNHDVLACTLQFWTSEPWCILQFFTSEPWCLILHTPILHRITVISHLAQCISCYQNHNDYHCILQFSHKKEATWRRVT